MLLQCTNHRVRTYALIVLTLFLLLGLLLWPRFAAATTNPVIAAWEKARAAGSYHFDSNVTQVTIPSPTVTNIGRSSRTQTLHLTGQADLRQEILTMQLWSDRGNVLQAESGLAVKLEQGQTFVRQPAADGWREWQVVESGIDGFAPQGDFLAYLAAVRDVQAHAPETRTLPGQAIRFTRYTFAIDGPAFANFMRDQLEDALRAKGELPPGMRLAAADYYRQMSGDGELWVREDGLPLRQILNLTFPEQQAEFVNAQIVVDFYRFGQPRTSLTDLAQAGDLAGLVAAIPASLPNSTPLLLTFPLLISAALMLRHRRARPVQVAVASAVIASLIITPLLSTFQADAFYAAQTAKAAAQEDQQASRELQQSLHTLGDRPEFNPQANPLENAGFEIQDSGFGITDLQSPNLSISQSPNLQTTDNGADSDNDGLSDFAEARVGTYASIADSDEDGLPDGVEVKGFFYAGKQWYSDPLAMDSNDDGIPDGTEWGRNTDGSLRAIPLDTDNDGVPDLFDPDNDGDGVPDRLDLSSFVQMPNTLSEHTPLNVTINNLTPHKPTFVDFQLRPTDKKHLWFAFNVLDWPRDDQGQVMDVEGGTYADLATAEGRAAIANESDGDMKLIPMLEIRLPAQGANLPPQHDLTPYGITVNNLTEDGSQQVAYVPLSLVTDDQTGQSVAFSGRMRYLPSDQWPAAHEVRLAWVVQVLVDLACNPEDPQQKAAGCTADGYIHNVPQVVQSYYDDWTLTGLNVSEQHGTTTAIIYEDPALDDNHHDDSALFALTHAFDETFLAARDQDNDAQRDVTIGTIAHNLSSLLTHWGLPSTLKVAHDSYPTFDLAAASMAMTGTLSLLDSEFDAYWERDQALMPTLLYAYEQHARALSLDALLAGSDQANLTLNQTNLVVDFEPASQPAIEPVTVAGIKWSHYCRTEASTHWTICPAETYWDVLHQRYGNERLPGDPADPDLQAGRLALTQIYTLALRQGIHNTVQQGNTLIPATYSLKDDPSIASTVRGALGMGRIGVVFLTNQAALANFNNRSFVAQVGKWYNNIVQNTRGNIQAFQELANGGEFRAGVVVLALKVLVVAGVLTATIIAAGALGGEHDTRIALRAIVLGLQIFLALIDPVLTFVRMSSYGVSLAYMTEFINISRTSLIVGSVISSAVVWGFFIYSMAASNVTPFSPEFNRALTETIAATIYLIVLALISMTIIGLILVGIVAVIDAILTAICELGVDDLRKVPGLGGACFTLGTLAIKAVAYLLYNYDVMINTERRDLISPGAPQTELADPSRGFVAGNELSISIPITTNISHKSPDAANGLMINAYLYFFSASNLRSTTFNYSLSQFDRQNLNAGLNTMSGTWRNVREHHRYAATTMYGGHADTTPAPLTGINLPAGLNQTPELYLNIGYALPAYECWVVPVLGIISAPVCYTRTFSGKNSTRIDTLHYDIFPASFAEFTQIITKPDGGYGLGWDSHFSSIADADGDGLRASAHGGLDPNDDPNTFGWDTDRDGLTDAYEMERQSAGFAFSPIQCDSDGDGLTDQQEARLGTNPANPDSDNDGLLDSEEVWHQVYDTASCQPTAAWVGGWEIEINASTPFTIRVASNPLRADSDGDGIDDLAERQLAQHADPTKRVDDEQRPYHPGIFNSSPIRIYPRTDKPYVRPGGSIIYTNTVVSNVEIVPSILDVFPSEVFGPAPAPALLNFEPLAFSGSQTVTHQMVLTAQPDLTTQSVLIDSSVRARMMETGPATLGWEPLVPQPLGAAAQPVRFGAATAPLPDRTDTFITSALLSATPLQGGTGFIQTNAIPSGESGYLANDGNTSGADTTVRGASAADIACNNLGACMVVWEERETCNTLTINYLDVIVANDQNSGIEPVIYWIADYDDTNPADGGYELLWNPLLPANNGRDLGSGVRRGPNANGFPIMVNVCGEGRLDIYEADTETINQHDPSNLDLIGSSLRIGPDNWDMDPNLDLRFTRSGVTSEVELNLSMSRKQLDIMRGALIGAKGEILRAPFELPLHVPADPSLRLHNFRPVVASDGRNFLVLSELAIESVHETYMQAQTFASDGLPSSQIYLHQLETVRVAEVTEGSVALDVVWVGDRYRIARKFIRPSGSQTIYIANYVPNHIVAPMAIWSTVTTAALYDGRGAPVLAYNPRANQTLLLYTHETFDVRRVLYQGGDLTPILNDAGLSPALTSQDPPHAVYHPMMNAWLLSWTTPPGLGAGVVYSLWHPDLSGRILADQKVEMAVSNFNSRAQGCPLPSALPVMDLCFEELPESNFTKYFIDHSGRGNGATCEGAACPASAAPGAVDDQGNAVGTPASDYALRFDGLDDAIVLPNPFPQAGRSNFSFAFWYKGGSTNEPANAQFWLIGSDAAGAQAMALRIYHGTGRLLFDFGGHTIEANAGLNDDQWHYIVATRDDMNNGHFALYLDGNPVPVAASNSPANHVFPTTFQIGGTGPAFSLDEFQIYATPLSGDTIHDLYTRSLQTYCIGTKYNQGVYDWTKLAVSTPDARGGKLTATAELRLTIDGDAPTTRFGLTNNQYIPSLEIVTIGGYANDPTSGVAGVEVRMDDDAFQPARGAGVWAYNLAVNHREGPITIHSRATDVAGNVGAPSSITVIADGTPPNLTLNALPATPTLPTRNAAGLWSATLSGTVSDPASGGQPGSGVVPSSLEVRLVAQTGNDDAQGNGWQAATLNGNEWRIDYLFAEGLPDPTGVYTVSVRAADQVGNQTPDNGVTGILKLDSTAPSAALNTMGSGTSQVMAARNMNQLADAGKIRSLITDPVTIGGVITDTGPAGVQQVEIAFVAVKDIAALPVDVSNEQAQPLLDAAGRIWLPATLAQIGAGVTTWSAQVPAGLEGEYQIDLRASDSLGNQRVSANVWRGHIDTLDPRLVMSAAATGVTYRDAASGELRYEMRFVCAAQDRNLNEASFVCPGQGLAEPVRSFDDTSALADLFPDLALRTGLAISYTLWSSTPTLEATVSACDSFGRCASLSNSATAGTVSPSSAPSAVVVSPSDGAYVAASGSELPVTVAAEAAAMLQTIRLRLDGSEVGLINFAQADAVDVVQHTFSLAQPSVGTHVLVAEATDWNGVTQTTLFPLEFTFDGAAPTVAINTVEVSAADTWMLGSGILQFSGTASDDVGLAAVQVKVDNGPWADAAFANGTWHIAYPVPDPEGQVLTVQVRAIDLAGQQREVSQEVPVNFSVPIPPDTTISSGPANPSTGPSVTFTFTGTAGTSGLAAFECRLNEGLYQPCSSPWTLDELSQGPQTVAVRAVDSQGYVDPTPATYGWTVTAGPLAVAITAAPSNPTVERTASFSFVASGVTGYECKLTQATFGADTTSFTSCVSGVTYDNLLDGQYTFEVRARNGEQIGQATRHTWQVINQAPVAHDQQLITLQAETITLTLTAEDGDPLTFRIVQRPRHGVLLGAAPDLIYVPDTDFFGSDSFTFQANDGQALSNLGTITINVKEQPLPTQPEEVEPTPTPPGSEPLEHQLYLPVIGK